MILLTGASGFIGSHILSMADCTQFRAVIRRESFNQLQLLYPELDFFSINNLTAQTDWLDAFNGCQSIIHLAGLAHSSKFSETDFHTVNVNGTINLATAAAKAGVKRFVFISSIGVNGAFTLDKPFSSLTEPNPHNMYAQSKFDTELALNKISAETGLELVIVRPTLVYGPDAPGNFSSLTCLIHKFPFLPFGLTSNRRDFISVQNLVDLLITCAKHPNAAGHTFLASDGESVSIKDFTNAIAKGLNKTLIQLPLPISLMRLGALLVGKSAMVEQLLGNLEVDSSNLKEVLDWVPPYTMEESMTFLKQDK
jgi:nucleoside-diphosphate-sugar epimerase